LYKSQNSLNSCIKQSISIFDITS